MKYPGLILLFLSSIISSMAQTPANDNCSGAINLTVNANNLCGVTTTGTTVGATQSMSGCNFTSADDDVWYKFTATATTHKIEVRSLTLQNPVFQVFSGPCTGLTSLACVNENNSTSHTEKSIVSGLTIGNEYFIRVHSGSSLSTTRGTFTICVGLPASPANDECAGAINLTVNQNQSCTLTTNATNADASQSMSGCSAGSVADDDVWFSFTATSAVHNITLSGSSVIVPVVELFDGSCGSLQSKACYQSNSPNFTLKIGDLTPGQTYLFRVYSYYQGLSQTGAFQVCINEATGMPANDACAGAIALTANNASCNILTSGTLVNASGPMAPTVCNGNPVQNDVWYKFTATQSDMLIKLLNATFGSPNLQLLSGTCSNPSSVICNNDGLMLAQNLTIGQEYYIRIWDLFGSSGTFDLCLSSPSVNSVSANAVDIPVNSGFTCIQNTAGNNITALSNEVSNAGCSTITDGLWYKFTATNDSLLVDLTSTGTGSGFRIELFHKQGANLVFKSFNSNRIFETGMTVGDEYYLLVYTCGSNALSRGSFDICVRNFPPPPANDGCVSAAPISVNNDMNCTLSTQGTTINALPGDYAFCSGEVDDDVWYSFVATQSKHFVNISPGTLNNAAFQVYEGNCANLSEINCTNNTSGSETENAKVSNLVTGGTYYVRVFSADIGIGEGTFDICVNLPLANEDCEGAIVLNTGSTCTPVNGTSVGVSNSIYDNCDFYKYGVWYKFTATSSSQLIRLERGTIQNVYIDVLENNCFGINRIGSCDSPGNDPIVEKSVFGLTVGTEYLIWINTTSQEDAGTFSICILDTEPPANDECSTAITLTVNPANVPVIKTSGNTNFATQSLAGCSGNADDDVWYSFTATQTSHRVFLQKINSFENIILEVFSGTCGTLVSKQCISSGFDETLNSSALISNLTIGQTYFIRVYYEGIVPGAFSIGITSLPVNDNCATAITLNPSAIDAFENVVSGSSFDATLSSNSYLGGTNTDDDVWFQFTATQKVHKIKLKGWKQNQGKIEVYSGACNALVPLSCSTPVNVPQCENGDLRGDTLILTLDKFTAGQVYRFRVFSNTIGTNQSLFEVAVTSPYVLPFDDCSGALNIPVAGTPACTVPTVVSTKGFSTISGESGGCNYGDVSGIPEKDIFLKFTATATQHKINLTMGQGLSLIYQLFSGTCGSLVSLGCSPDYDSVSYLGNLTVGQTYFIRVLMYYTNIESLKVCISTPAFASNDECTGATPVVPSGDAASCTITTGDLINSSQTQFTECYLSGNSKKKIMRDVWYKFVASTTSHKIWLGNTSDQYFDLNLEYTRRPVKFELFGGTCQAKTYLDCSADIVDQGEKTFTGLTVGSTYYLRVSSYSPGDARFQFCIKNGVVPVNDLCSNAVVLPVNNTLTNNNYIKGNTVFATATNGPNTCGAANSFDVWYKFTAAAATQFVVFRKNSNTANINDLTVAVYSGNCNTPVHVACKRSDFTNVSEDFIKLEGLTTGNEYLIKVYSFTADINHQGTFDIQVVNSGPPANDPCASPTPLNIHTTASLATYVSSTTFLSTTSPEAVGCAVTGTPDDDVWYSFIATKSSHRLLLVSTVKDLAYVVYSGTCGSLVSIVCGNSGAGSFSLNTVLNNLTPGTAYLVRAYTVSSVLRGRIFAAVTSDTDPPANNLCSDAVTLTPAAGNTPVFTEGTTVNATNTNAQCFGGNEVWYKFTATATTHRIIYDGYVKDPAVVMLTGSCGAFSIVSSTCFTGVHNISFTKTGLTIGTTYYLKIAAQATNEEDQGNFKIGIITPVVPSNDNCANATLLTANAAPQFFSSNLATNESNTAGCGFLTKDVWFRFVATGPKMNVEVDNLNTNAIIGAYTDACNNPVLIKCTYENSGPQQTWKSNILELTNLVAGTSYLINVAAVNNAETLEFKIKLFDVAEINQNGIYANTCLSTNLVPNPSFENPDRCPESFVPSPSAPGQTLLQGLGWNIPTSGSADYFSTCAVFNASIEVPRNNIFGIQSARSGKGYAGIFTGGSEYREYLHTPFNQPMVVGKRYLLSMYVSRADYYLMASNNLGFGLSVRPVIEFDSDSLKTDRMILPAQNIVIHEKDNWVNIAAEITADQAFENLYIGNFRKQSNTLTQESVDISGGASGGYGGQAANTLSYYFIDDVFVGELSNTIACGANDCNSNIVLTSPNDNISGGSTAKKTNLQLKANITIQGNANVLFQSNQSILMDASLGVFEIKNGVVFEAKIGGCVN